MKKILSKNDIVLLYIEENPEKCSIVGNLAGFGNVRTFDPDTIHFRKFMFRQLFLNHWKKTLNKVEAKFFPEYAVPRFTRTKIKRKKKPAKKSKTCVHS